ncbi:ABC transporter ATP-binding protein [Algihabitans albus]|uniref:ABC transporter ATP-binding protein n=1 Tax=Algihabitans albus TaxID=2164067 RepID=UPI000E5D53D0|nr:sn-glycerol-3-phosphate ABC transporter ATP-binding protein UgpC [Algihabitans albus]
MATVEYRNIAKSYGSFAVMHDLNLSIADGEFAVLLGASGCGKTTLLRMTAGLETVTAGDLLIDDLRVNDVPPRDRDIAMVFQNYALYPTMTVAENISFSLEIRSVPKVERRRRAEDAAALVGLTEHLNRYPRELSGGQRQRVAMARAMVRDAKVFLFDEPLSNLDAKLRAQMRFEIRQLHDRLGTTTIYVTHDQIEAMTMADKIVLMRGGEIEQVGSPDELYDRPVSRFAADFIGSPAMNFVEGTVEANGNAPTFVAEGMHLGLPTSVSVTPGHQVVCGMRPADLMLDSDGSVEGHLILAEKTGPDLQLHMTVAGQDFIATAPRDAKVSAGDRVRLAVAPENLHLFDPVSGQRL